MVWKWQSAAVAAVACLCAIESQAEKAPPRARMAVEDVIASPEGHFIVVLKTAVAPYRYLPIWVGEGEAFSIRLRLDRKTPPRPLTLNLLEAIMDSSNVKLVDIIIDDVKGGVFLGTVRLRQQGRTFALDARPSDAIGLAVGRGAPIFVSEKVLNDAALDASRLGLDQRKGGDDKKPGSDAPAPVSDDETL
jgi:bifunctional DNase/RNase